MKNIYELLKDYDVEIPEDKKEEFNKKLHENYKTIAEYNGINNKLEKAEKERDSYKTKYDDDIKSRDEDLANLKKQLEDADDGSVKIEELTNQLATLQSNYDEAQAEYTKQLTQQKYEYAVKEQVNGLKFTSNSAKKAFLNEAIAKNMPMEDGSILGFQDFVDKYKEQDAGAFVEENDDETNNKPKPKFSGNSSTVDDEDSGDNTDTSKAVPVIW